MSSVLPRQRLAKGSDIPAAVAAMVKARSGGCDEVTGQPGATDLHHRLGKGMGGTRRPDIHDPANLLHVTRLTHHWIHAYPAEARAGGWIVPSHRSPLAVPVWRVMPFPSWWLLEDHDALVVPAHAADHGLPNVPVLPPHTDFAALRAADPWSFQ